MALKMYQGDAAIRKGIRSLDKVIGNVNDRVQDLAVSIINHAANEGNGDMSRALDLCKTVARHRTLNVAFLVGYFRYFGSTNVNLRANDGAGKVSVIDRKSDKFRGFDVEGAKVHRWNEAVNADGDRANWYQGPTPAEYEPATLYDESERIKRFAENELKRLDATKTVNGKEVPVVALSKDERRQMENALDVMKRLATTLATREHIEHLKVEIATTEQEVDPEMVEFLQREREKAVA